MKNNHTPAGEWNRRIAGFEIHDCPTVPAVSKPPQEQSPESSRYEIRLANTEDRRNSADTLVKRRYAWRGYDVKSGIHHFQKNITLITTTTGNIPVATVSLQFDSETGVAADKTYGTELNQLRQEGRKLCEMTQFAIETKTGSKRVMASLVHICLIYGYLIHRYTDFICEINPRHLAFYQKMMGFEQIGEERICLRVNAPAVLIRIDMAYMSGQIAALGGQANAAGIKSLYSSCFSKVEEAEIISLLMHEGGDAS